MRGRRERGRSIALKGCERLGQCAPRECRALTQLLHEPARQGIQIRQLSGAHVVLAQPHIDAQPRVTPRSVEKRRSQHRAQGIEIALPAGQSDELERAVDQRILVQRLAAFDREGALGVRARGLQDQAVVQTLRERALPPMPLLAQLQHHQQQPGARIACDLGCAPLGGSLGLVLRILKDQAALAARHCALERT